MSSNKGGQQSGYGLIGSRSVRSWSVYRGNSRRPTRVGVGTRTAGFCGRTALITSVIFYPTKIKGVPKFSAPQILVAGYCRWYRGGTPNPDTLAKRFEKVPKLLMFEKVKTKNEERWN